GQSVSTKIFVDKDQTEAILGRVLDLKADPWGRVDVSKMHLKDRPVLGPASAPVTLIEFADFECPYCAHAFSGVETAVNNTYQGKVKLIFKNYPLNMHPWALKAAEAAECARMQNPDAFWSFARYFYSNQNKIKPENLQDNVDKLAADSKLDDKALRACMESPQTAARIKQDQDDGALGKVNSTPTFFIDGIPLVGLPEGDAFKFVLDSELARKK
ncbi:MAG TPA: thioredoxin domain-containing protein, partial [Candidatus Binataceae bacterium]|nr:thioredoxin domain-containing protein [Candidatus Binataceae bacterium]